MSRHSDSGLELDLDEIKERIMLERGEKLFKALSDGESLNALCLRYQSSEEKILTNIEAWINSLKPALAQENKDKLYKLNIFKLHCFAALVAKYKLTKQQFKFFYTEYTRLLYDQALALVRLEQYYKDINAKEAKRYAKAEIRVFANLGEHIYAGIRLEKLRFTDISYHLEISVERLEKAVFTWCNTFPKNEAQEKLKLWNAIKNQAE